MAGGASDSGDDGINGINVTPLVDVTLVLLIIFIVTAKLIVSQSIPLDLPKAANSGDVQTVFSVTLAVDGRTQIDGKTVESDEAIMPAAKDARSKNPELRAVIKADNLVPHGRVIHVLDLLKTADVKKIAFGVSPLQAGQTASPVVPAGTGATKD